MTTSALLTDFDDTNFWVFGYGSLMWNPGFSALHWEPATLQGYQRRFCIYSTHYRGTPDRPGLVLGLARVALARALPSALLPKTHQLPATICGSASWSVMPTGKHCCPFACVKPGEP